MPKDSRTTSAPVLLLNPPKSGVPLLTAALAVVLAVGYGVLLGYVFEVSDVGQAITFILYFAGLGAGVAFAVRCCPASAGIGIFSFAVVPVVFTRIGGWTEWPQPIVTLAAAGGVAFGIFLLAVGAETLLRWPKSIQSLLTARDAVGGVFLGLVLTLVVFIAWAPPETIYRSLWMQLIHYVVIATRGLLLVASGLIPVLFITRKRVITPAVVVGSVYGIAILPGGTGYTIWSATPEFLAEYGIILLILALAAGFVELAGRMFFSHLLKPELISLGQ